jgi:hypothetical protein
MPETVGPKSSATNPPFTDILLSVNFYDPKEVAKKETGLKIAQRIYTEQTQGADSLNFFTARAAKWIQLLKWATGTQDMTEFLDFFNVSDGNKAYVKIDMTPIMVGPQFVLTLVDSMSKNQEYPCVTAIDQASTKEKETRKQDALYRMQEVDRIAQVQEATGVMVEAPDAYVPDDKVSADVYFELQDRLPKEMYLETKLQDTLDANDYERELKPRCQYDLVVFNMGVTKIDIKPNGSTCLRKPVAQNTFYNYFIGDSGKYQLAYIGEVYSLKVRDMRAMYGKSPEKPDGLTEQEIYDLARMSSTRNTGLGFNFLWKLEYQFYNYNCPWDDYSIYVIDFEIKIGASDYYVGKPDSYGRENIAPKQSIPKPVNENAKIYKKDKNRWYRGVYAPYAKKMIYWGLPDVVIIPFLNTEESLSSYSINIPFNNGQYMPSLFERGMEPLREYALIKLKRKQLIAKLRPSGIRIDVHSARNIDLGNGNVIPWEEVVRIFDQTGNEVWSSRGIDPLRQESPAISAGPSDDTLQKIMQLTQVAAGVLGELRELFGVPRFRDGSDVGDRTAAKLAEGQSESSFNVTDFIPNSFSQLMEETLYKCALIEWQKAVKEGDEEMINSKFRVSVEMKLTAYEKQQIENLIAIGMQEQLLSFKDAFMIRQIKNYKLANWYLDAMIEKNKKEQAKANMDSIKANAEAQQASLQQKAKADADLEIAKQRAEAEREENGSENKKKEILLQGVLQMINTSMTAGQPIPAEYKPIVNQALLNVGLPLMAENTEMQQQMLASASQAGVQQQQSAQAAPEEEGSMEQEVPEESMQ